MLDHLTKKNDVTLLTFKHDPSLPDREESGALTVVRMPHEMRVSKGFVSVRSLGYFWKYVKDCDVVIITVPNAEALALAGIAKARKKRVIVLYLCDVDLGGALGSRVINWVLNASIDVQLKLSDKIIAFPDYIDHRPAYREFGEKIVPLLPPVITPPADQTFAKTLAAGKKNKVWVGFAGRLAREKGIEYLIKALQKIDDSRFELVIAGPALTVGEHAYSDSVMNLLEKSRIKYHRFVSLTDIQLATLYESLDMVVLPSVNSTEAFGMVQAEAMLHGTPAIASDLPGVRLPVKLTGCGAVVRPADPEDLARAIKALAKSPFKRADVIKKAKTVFDPKPVYEEVDSLLLSNK